MPAMQNQDSDVLSFPKYFDPSDIDRTDTRKLLTRKKEGNALIALAESQGIDVDTIKEQACGETRDALKTAIEASHRNRSQADGQQGNAGSQGEAASPQGLADQLAPRITAGRPKSAVPVVLHADTGQLGGDRALAVVATFGKRLFGKEVGFVSFTVAAVSSGVVSKQTRFDK